MKRVKCLHLFAELHAELLCHVVRVEGVGGGVLLVEEVHLEHDGGEVVLVRAELVGGDVYLLVEGEGGPLPLRQGEGEGARAHVLVSLQCEDEVLPRPCPHIHVGTRLTRETLVDTWAIRFYSDSFITIQWSNYTHTHTHTHHFLSGSFLQLQLLKVHLVQLRL